MCCGEGVDNFQEALKQLLGARYAEFETLSAVEKTSYVLGSERTRRVVEEEGESAGG